MRFGFSGIGLIIFILPMIINMVYVVFPPKTEDKSSVENGKYPFLEGTEQITRIAYLIALCILISNKPLVYNSPLLFISIAFLILYYIVWIRYFVGGR